MKKTNLLLGMLSLSVGSMFLALGTALKKTPVSFGFLVMSVIVFAAAMVFFIKHIQTVKNQPKQN